MEPPSEPPPLLNFNQIRHLAYHGWLSVDLPEHLRLDIQALSTTTQSFFDRTLDHKTETYPSSRGTECGFYVVPGEKEYITFRHHKACGSTLEQRVDTVWRQCAQLLHRILCDLSRAGYHDVHIWDHLVHGSLALPESDVDIENVITLMRLFRYYPDAGVAEEHVDIGLLTLCIGGSRGLQVLDRETKEYVDATGPTILVGDTTRALLNNRVRSGMHRVISNPAGRFSIVFALRPNLSGTIDRAVFGGEGTVSSRTFFYDIKGSKYNINATKDVREKQQEEQKSRKKTTVQTSVERSGTVEHTIEGNLFERDCPW